MSFLINPYAFLAAGGDFESIATVTVGSGGAANIEFTSIPGTYQHLQVRFIGRGTAVDTSSDVRIQLNSDTGSNYAWHYLAGNGAVTDAGAVTSTAAAVTGYRGIVASTGTASAFGACVVDVLDYASTTKTKVVRTLGGHDRNGAGLIGIVSTLWNSTSAITTVKFLPSAGDFAQYTTAALYGIKAP